MNYKTIVTGLFFIIFHSYNLMAQEITIQINKSKFNIDEPIAITYHIDKKIDSAAVDNKNFTIESGPDTAFKSNYSEVSFILKAFKPGRMKLPRLQMYSEDEIIQSKDLFVEIIDKEFTSDDLKLLAYKAGYAFNISLPVYIKRATGINDSSAIQFKSEKDSVYGYVVLDEKKNNNLPKTYAINSYYEQIIKDFITDKEKIKNSSPQFLKRGEINFIETDMTILDKVKKKPVHYFIGVAETSKAFYQFILWAPEESQTKIKTDFQNILYSIKD